MYKNKVFKIIKNVVHKIKKHELFPCPQCWTILKMSKEKSSEGTYYQSYCPKCNTIHIIKSKGTDNNGFKKSKDTNKTK